MSWKYCGWLLKKWAPSACRQTQTTTSRPSGQTQTGNESYICSNITRIYKCTHTHTHTSPTEPAQRRQKEHRLSSTPRDRHTQ